ncbi:MAG: hypothetical protein A3C93_04985 [Candidatus Lloydbacteria bacterium RIFCSPHIGHO2_02_FULL_54_17]|uniref:histidine kinase n=1 Tax=Candidatus Lloydbacteria bacterium RIFCSPHIGHO2_02_FULL_54_17 TaxID=1798664 RepID=A0A1G2DBY9_9BACT|nr:MAG: hypothetical protein A2762_05770 [Candidatus Lloydbacteria bacterium RIFCSPHIGHO2_01_FULL_54_11]OGZ11124.1 MAG: hypothetical protein A3C93_04985 [Candidatus Lloydbacteria bacterium RIFCSPHIGHO2_02_FULL_54_17]OGZ16948.1 MAG: hypothetical protein A3H76_03400 [Candidatus Lloydbacteria bacterium RIFCSPLOWO2_02_FULL_54_12]
MELIADFFQRFKAPLLVFAGAVVPQLAVFYALRASPLGKTALQDPLMFFVLWAVVVGFSVLTAYFYYRLYAKNPIACLYFASVSVFVFTVTYVFHGIAMLMISHDPSPRNGMLFDIAEHYGLFLSALLFVGMVLPFRAERSFLYQHRKRIYLGVAVLLGAAIALVYASESVVRVLYGATDAVVVMTGLVLIAAGLFLAYDYSRSRNLLNLYLIFGLTVMAGSCYLPFYYAEWDLLWWYLHLVFPVGYTAIFIGMISYERGDLALRLFFGKVPFYKKIGTKLALTIFFAGLVPLLTIVGLMSVSAPNVLGHLFFGEPVSYAVFIEDVGSFQLLIFRFALVIALLFVLSAFFSFYFAGRLVLPLKMLSEAADKIARGGEVIRVDIGTGDEIEVLAESFNKMSTDLKRLHVGMEQEIAAKTAELSKKVAETDALVASRTVELGQERARLIASIDSIPFGFLIANNDGRVLLENRILSDLFQLDDKKVNTVWDIGDRFGKKFDLRARVEECMKGRKVCEIKEILFGSKFLRGIIAPIITGDDSSGTIGYVILFEDITEAKVQERSRDEFFAVASHELRTPLTAIRGNTAMLQDMYKDQAVDADVKGMLDDIHEASVRLIAIVNDFLDVARLEQGETSMKKTKFDIAEPIEETLRDMKNPAEQKGLTLRFNKPDKVLEVTGDKDRLRQILTNLVGNAVKFSPKGVITVEVELEPKQQVVKISVRDPGMGISPERQALLFHKFQQAGEQVLARDVTQGTGLGLYISKLLIERMGGTIGLAKSAQGEGSTFYFTLPIAS